MTVQRAEFIPRGSTPVKLVSVDWTSMASETDAEIERCARAMHDDLRVFRMVRQNSVLEPLQVNGRTSWVILVPERELCNALSAEKVRSAARAFIAGWRAARKPACNVQATP